jgi:hypothetical protein
MNYIPRSDGKFDSFFRNLINYLTTKTSGATPVWTHIPPAAMTALNILFDNWCVAYDVVKGPHNPVETEMKNEAHDTAEKALREFIQRYLLWNPVTDIDRVAMGLPIRDKIKTPQGAPNIQVGFVLEPAEIYQVRMRFWVLETGEERVPKNMNGVMLYTLISDTPITNQEDLRFLMLLTNHLTTLSFHPADRSKTVYLACRWEGKSGGSVGEWSPVQSIVIP